MPLIKPKDKETREDFISRCMADDKTTSEFPATDQRLAVCNTQYKNNKKKENYSMNDIEKMGEAIKSLTDVISSKAKQRTDIKMVILKLKKMALIVKMLQKQEQEK
jgi:hypothetical protein